MAAAWPDQWHLAGRPAAGRSSARTRWHQAASACVCGPPDLPAQRSQAGAAMLPLQARSCCAQRAWQHAPASCQLSQAAWSKQLVTTGLHSLGARAGCRSRCGRPTFCPAGSWLPGAAPELSLRGCHQQCPSQPGLLSSASLRTAPLQPADRHAVRQVRKHIAALSLIPCPACPAPHEAVRTCRLRMKDLEEPALHRSASPGRDLPDGLGSTGAACAPSLPALL